MANTRVPRIPGFTYLGGRREGYAVDPSLLPTLPPDILRRVQIQDDGTPYLSRRQYMRLAGRPDVSSPGRPYRYGQPSPPVVLPPLVSYAPVRPLMPDRRPPVPRGPQTRTNELTNSFIRTLTERGEDLPRTRTGGVNRNLIKADPRYQLLRDLTARRLDPEDMTEKQAEQLREAFRFARQSGDKNPKGILAQLLVAIGKRSADWTWEVGDTP